MGSHLHLDALMTTVPPEGTPSGVRDVVSTLCRRLFKAHRVDFVRDEHAETVLATLAVVSDAVRAMVADEGLEPGRAWDEVRRNVVTAIYDTQHAVRADRDLGGRSTGRSR
ncbi:MAG: hypothetical protein ACRDZO_06415 [Egibacteraceae bacterium]